MICGNRSAAKKSCAAARSDDHLTGTIYGFLPNGTGKTTTIRMLCGLLTPDSGEGTCLGFNIRTQSAEIKRRAGYMPQRFGLYDDLTIRENLEFVARLYEMHPTRARTGNRNIASSPGLSTGIISLPGNYPAAGNKGSRWQRVSSQAAITPAR